MYSAFDLWNILSIFYESDVMAFVSEVVVKYAWCRGGRCWKLEHV